MGIRLIPVASSGVDKSTEFMLRSFAIATGGEYQVEYLGDLIVRLIGEYTK